MLLRLVQPSKAPPPILVTPHGIVTLLRLVQPSKVKAPILVTLDGIEILLRLLQPTKTPPPILVTLVGIVMLLRLTQPLKAHSPILVTPHGIVMLPRLLQPEKVLLPMLDTLVGIVMPLRAVQPEKAFSPMLVTPSRISTVSILPLYGRQADAVSIRLSKSSIGPEPEIVSVPDASSSAHCRSPQSPIIRPFTWKAALFKGSLSAPISTSIIVFRLPSQYTSVRLVQPWKAPSPMLLTLAGIVMLVMAVQL